jgi:hypothetical protein
MTSNHLTTGGSGSSLTSYSTSSITPGAGRLIIATILTSTASANIPTISGNGLTWTRLTTVQSSVLGSWYITTFYAWTGASPSTGAITFDFGGQSQGATIWSVSEFITVSQTAPIVQVAAHSTGGSHASEIVTLSAFASASNAAYGFMVWGQGAAVTAGSGFSELSQSGQALGMVEIEFKVNDNTVDWSFVSASNTSFAIAVEIAAEISSASPSLSPSASRSPSSSSSASLSPSASASRSQSPSSSISSSASMSPSASVSASKSPSPSISLSVSPSPSAGYSDFSRGAHAVLPTTTDELETVYSLSEEVSVASRDTSYVSEQGAGTYMLHQFKLFVGAVPECQVEFQGKSTLAPSLSPVYLQLYNYSTSSWQTVDSNGTVIANEDFELEEKITDTTNYRDASGIITARVYQLAL